MAKELIALNNERKSMTEQGDAEGNRISREYWSS